MNELGTTKVYMDVLEKRIKELQLEKVDSPLANICINHINNELEKLIKFLKP